MAISEKGLNYVIRSLTIISWNDKLPTIYIESIDHSMEALKFITKE